jgi:DNA polymerase I-like protein with 3'-5' exonuclease and polymerase domains
MQLITIDFETYYDQEFSLGKLTTEEYIRSPQFEVIGVGVKVDNKPVEWASGTMSEIRSYLWDFDWENSAVLAHNTMFDGAILSWLFGVKPKLWLDTLCMARALHGVEVGGSLAALAEKYGLGQKGTEVVNAKGKRRIDFEPTELSRYGDYCTNDVEMTYKLFHILGNGYPKKELRIIDTTLRMFFEPVLVLDKELLKEHLHKQELQKEELLATCGVAKDELMSNPKFAEALKLLGVNPPMKTSPATGKQTFAFSKTDKGLTELLDHEDFRVQALVSARLGVKSTLEETRTQRFLDIASRGALPVPIRYYAAHTGRFGGDDKINMQNLPSRGPNAKTLKRAVMAPPGHVLIDADSSQIEARVLAWLAGQEDIVEAFARGKDVYKKMASAIYGVEEDQINKQQRFVGKTAVLGCGYGLGALKFQTSLENSDPPMMIDLEEARRIIEIYRTENNDIVRLWRQAQHMLGCMVRDEPVTLGREGVLTVLHDKKAIQLPSGLLMRYDGLLSFVENGNTQYTYKTRKGMVKIYGGKVVENVCQAIARCIIAEQMLKVAKKYKVVMTVHDAITCVVPEGQAEEAMAYVIECMRWVPEWATGLPVNCEASYSQRYGDC